MIKGMGSLSLFVFESHWATLGWEIMGVIATLVQFEPRLHRALRVNKYISAKERFM